MGVPDDAKASSVTLFVSCAVPVTIASVDQSHILYEGRANLADGGAIELRAFLDRTVWLPVAGGPSYITIWESVNRFYLYDLGEMGEADWDRPYIYDRCP